MSSNPLEEILMLAKTAKSKSSVKASADSDADNDNDELPSADHDEWQDNEDMHAQGLTMGPSGDVHHGAMKVGHVVSVPKSKNRYVGIHHPSGAVTDAHPNRARAAMALMEFHHFLPHKGESSPHPGMKLSNDNLEEVLALAAKDKNNLRIPEQGAKKYGSVTFADPKNKKYPIDTEAHVRAALSYINKPHNASVYPLNGVSVSEVKARIVAAAKRMGIEVSGD